MEQGEHHYSLTSLRTPAPPVLLVQKSTSGSPHRLRCLGQQSCLLVHNPFVTLCNENYIHLNHIAPILYGLENSDFPSENIDIRLCLHPSMNPDYSKAVQSLQYSMHDTRYPLHVLSLRCIPHEDQLLLQASDKEAHIHCKRLPH